jgi:hypothetical protein
MSGFMCLHSYDLRRPAAFSIGVACLVISFMAATSIRLERLLHISPGDEDEDSVVVVSGFVPGATRPHHPDLSVRLHCTLRVVINGVMPASSLQVCFVHQYHGPVQDLFISQSHVEGWRLVLKVRPLSSGEEHTMSAEIDRMTGLPDLGFPAFVGVHRARWHGHDTVFWFERHAGDSVGVWLSRLRCVQPPRFSELVLVSHIIRQCMLRFIRDALDRGLVYSEMHMQHITVSGVMPWQSDGDGLQFLDKAVPDLELCWIDRSEARLDSNLDMSMFGSRIRSMLLGISRSLRLHPGACHVVWQAIAGHLERLAESLAEGLIEHRFAAAHFILQMCEGRWEVFDTHSMYLVPLPVAGTWSAGSDPTLLSSHSRWPALWNRLLDGYLRRCNQRFSSFRGEGHYAMPRVGRLSLSDRVAARVLHHSPFMPPWCSDVVNRVVDILFIALRPLFQAVLFVVALLCWLLIAENLAGAGIALPEMPLFEKLQKLLGHPQTLLLVGLSSSR